MAGNPWLAHLKAYWAKHKGKGMSYKQAMVDARKTYKKVASVERKKKARTARK